MAANTKEMETKASMFLNGISLVQHGRLQMYLSVTSSTILKAAS
jgi:hypothetical protein